MPRYLIKRNFGPRDEEEMAIIGADSKRVIAEHTPDIIWEISHVVADEAGNITTFCIYAGPDEERIREHGKMLGRHDIESIYEIGGQVSPADFPA